MGWRALFPFGSSVSGTGFGKSAFDKRATSVTRDDKVDGARTEHGIVRVHELDRSLAP